MSELKAGVIKTPHDEGMSFSRDSDHVSVTEGETEFYLKSEVDKVIAKLTNEIEEQKRLRDMALASMPNVLKVMKIIQHHKYKRCLAMAEWCDAEADVADADGDYEDMRWYQKWHERWLKLAEQFKED